MRNRGFTLIELLVAMAVGVVLTTGLLHLVQSATAAYRLQNQLGHLQENARFAVRTIESALQPAGYDPRPWLGDGVALGAGSADGFNAAGDRIELRRQSARNCFGNDNPVTGASGRPDHHLRVTEFFVRAGGDLVSRCRYGADEGSLITQINNLGLVQQVEAFQLQYAEDTDADGIANRWVGAGQWLEESRILGVRFALLLASPAPLSVQASGPLRLLDQEVTPPDDGHARYLARVTVMLEGRGS